jgi:hypothetical protein
MNETCCSDNLDGLRIGRLGINKCTEANDVWLTLYDAAENGKGFGDEQLTLRPDELLEFCREVIRIANVPCGTQETTPHVSMNKEIAEKILTNNCALSDDGNGVLGGGDVVGGWRPGEQTIQLDGIFTPDELEAFAWWVRNTPNAAVRGAAEPRTLDGLVGGLNQEGNR